MDYQVWTKVEYGEDYKKVDCGDLQAAKREIDKAVRDGLEPMLTVEVPYKLDIKISEVGTEVSKYTKAIKKAATKGKEVAEVETDQSEAGPDKDTGPES